MPPCTLQWSQTGYSPVIDGPAWFETGNPPAPPYSIDGTMVRSPGYPFGFRPNSSGCAPALTLAPVPLVSCQVTNKSLKLVSTTGMSDRIVASRQAVPSRFSWLAVLNCDGF